MKTVESAIKELKEINAHENYFIGKKKDKKTGELYDYIGIKLIVLSDEENMKKDESDDVDDVVVEDYAQDDVLSVQEETSDDDDIDVNQIERVIYNETPAENKMSDGEKINYLKSKGWEIQTEIKTSNKYKSMIFYKKI